MLCFPPSHNPSPRKCGISARQTNDGDFDGIDDGTNDGENHGADCADSEIDGIDVGIDDGDSDGGDDIDGAEEMQSPLSNLHSLVSFSGSHIPSPSLPGNTAMHMIISEFFFEYFIITINIISIIKVTIYRVVHIFVRIVSAISRRLTYFTQFR